ncbi:MAG: nucleotide sugar dehydrogenase [Simkaniaceae bacterium]
MRLFFIIVIFLSNFVQASDTNNSSIAIIGTGYVGLVTGTYFAELGHKVTCVDIDYDKIRLLTHSQIPFYEPGLEELVAKNQKEGRLIFTNSIQQAVDNSLILFLCVGTPANEDGSSDLSYLFHAAKNIADCMTDYRIIAIKSTVPPGTADQLKHFIHQILVKKLGKKIAFDVVSNPEFLREGTAVADAFHPDRIVIGCSGREIQERFSKLYKDRVEPDRILLMDNASAELTKQAANAMLASRISFMNEIARICDKIGANINHVKNAISMDKRIGGSFLNAGIGFGGSCFPKDLRSLISFADKLQVPTPLISSIYQTNELQKKLITENFISHLDLGEEFPKVVAVWGLSFKPGTDDMREAPSINLIRSLYKKGCHLKLFDPVSNTSIGAQKLCSDCPNVQFCNDQYEAAEEADAVILVTEWPQFKQVDLKRLSRMMKGNLFFDGRNQFSPEEMKKYGFQYYGVGLSSRHPSN